MNLTPLAKNLLKLLFVLVVIGLLVFQTFVVAQTAKLNEGLVRADILLDKRIKALEVTPTVTPTATPAAQSTSVRLNRPTIRPTAIPTVKTVGVTAVPTK